MNAPGTRSRSRRSASGPVSRRRGSCGELPFPRREFGMRRAGCSAMRDYKRVAHYVAQPRIGNRTPFGRVANSNAFYPCCGDGEGKAMFLCLETTPWSSDPATLFAGTGLIINDGSTIIDENGLHVIRVTPLSSSFDLVARAWRRAHVRQ
jgi:hypothetical protein